MTTLASFGKLSRKKLFGRARAWLFEFEWLRVTNWAFDVSRTSAKTRLFRATRNSKAFRARGGQNVDNILSVSWTHFDASKKTFLKAYSPLDEDVIIISREIVCLHLKSHSLSRCCLLSFSSLFNSLLTKRVYSCLISHFGVLGRRRPFSRQNRLSRFVHLQLGDDTLGRVDADLHGSACDLF